MDSKDFPSRFPLGGKENRGREGWGGSRGCPVLSKLAVGRNSGSGQARKDWPTTKCIPRESNQRSMLEASNLRQPLEHKSRAPLDEARRMAGIRFTASRGKENPGLLFSGELSKCNQEILITSRLGSITGCFLSAEQCSPRDSNTCRPIENILSKRAKPIQRIPTSERRHASPQ